MKWFKAQCYRYPIIGKTELGADIVGEPELIGMFDARLSPYHESSQEVVGNRAVIVERMYQVMAPYEALSDLGFVQLGEDKYDVVRITNNGTRGTLIRLRRKVA